MGKGCKGKGKETFEQKTQRLDWEISNAAALQDQEGLINLWSVREGHINSNWRQPDNHYYADPSKGKGKGKGKGKMGKTQSESAKVQALRTEIKNLKIQNAGEDPADKRGRASSRGSSRASPSSRGSSNGSKGSAVKGKTKVKLTKAQRAKRNEEKKEKKKLAKPKELQDGTPPPPPPHGEPRPTRVCPACYDQRTYASSVKCWNCKEPFTTPVGMAAPTPTPAAPTPTAAEEAARATLKSCQVAAASRVASYAETAKKAVTFAAAVPPPPPPAPPLVAALAAPTSASLSAADTATVAKETAELLALQTRKQSAEASRATFADDPTMTTALATHIAVLEQAIKIIMDKRQQELQPHQVSMVLSQRQHELTMAIMKVSQLEKSVLEGTEAAQKAAKEVHDGYDKEITAMQDAQKAAHLAFTTEQVATAARSQTEVAAAQLNVRILQQRVSSLQTTAASAAAAAAAAVAAAAALSQQATTLATTPTPSMEISPTPPPTYAAPLPMVTLPRPPDIEDTELDQYALAMSVLEHHQIQDHEFPLRYQDVTLCSKVVARLVGSEVWLQAYPAERPTEADNLPKRVLGALRVAMTRLAISVEARDKVSPDRVTELLTTAAEAANVHTPY